MNRGLRPDEVEDSIFAPPRPATATRPEKIWPRPSAIRPVRRVGRSSAAGSGRIGPATGPWWHALRAGEGAAAARPA